MANIHTKEDHTYSHFNRAMNIKIESKAHYEYEMKRRGMIPKEKADDIARKERERRDNPPPAKFSKKAREIIRATKCRADKKGNVKLGDNTIDAMREIGVAINHPHTPKNMDERWSSD